MLHLHDLDPSRYHAISETANGRAQDLTELPSMRHPLSLSGAFKQSKSAPLPLRTWIIMRTGCRSVTTLFSSVQRSL
jgi:hypothetical protein